MSVAKDVVIAMPAYDNKTEFEIYRAIYDCINDPNNPVSNLITYNGDSLVSRARNECVLLFEQMPVEHAKYLIFIDSDIHFQPSDVARVRSHSMPVCAGLYFLKNMHTAPVLNTPIGAPAGNLQQVREVGTGFLMIRRDVFAGLRAMGIAKTYKPGSNQHNLESRRTEFFPVGVLDDVLQSEDYYFCRMCEQINVPVYVDTTVVVKHKGWAMYPFQPKVLIEALPAALKSFKDQDEKNTVQADDVQKVIDAYTVYQSRNPVKQPAATQPVETDFLITHTSKGDELKPSTTGEIDQQARGGA